MADLNLDAALLDALCDRIAERVVDRLRAVDQPGWIDQASSPLGARRHCALARKLIAEGKGAASHVGRRWLIRKERLDREMGAPEARADSPDDEREAALARELGLKLVGR
jgi:hypothetical protein